MNIVITDLYDGLNLPVIPASTEAPIKCVWDHADELAKQQTGAWKQQRIKMKVARIEDQEAKKKWVKQQALRHTYGGDSEEDGDDDGQLGAELLIVSRRKCHCGSTQHQCIRSLNS